MNEEKIDCWSTGLPIDAHEVRDFLGTILQARREQLAEQTKEGSQTSIARRADLSQGMISSWEHPKPSGPSLGRESLKRLLTLGLQFPYEQADALLWLARPLWRKGGVLSKGDVIDLVQTYDPNAVFRERSDAEYEETIFSILAEVQNHSRPSAQIQIFSAAEEDRIRFEKAFLEMENVEQPRMTMSNLPPFISRPWNEMQEERQRNLPGILPPAAEQIANFLKLRYESWYRWVTSCNFRTILSKPRIADYFTGPDTDGLAFNRVKRRMQLAHWIDVLRSSPNYQLALTEKPVLMPSVLVGTSALMLLSDTPPVPTPVLAGVRGILVKDPYAVREFRIQFEREWKDPQLQKDQAAVTQWLSRLLDNPS